MICYTFISICVNWKQSKYKLITDNDQWSWIMTKAFNNFTSRLVDLMYIAHMQLHVATETYEYNIRYKCQQPDSSSTAGIIYECDSCSSCNYNHKKKTVQIYHHYVSGCKWFVKLLSPFVLRFCHVTSWSSHG